MNTTTPTNAATATTAANIAALTTLTGMAAKTRDLTVSDRPRPADDLLRDAIEQHRLWVETSGREGVRADLSELDLSGFDFTGVNLSSARLNGSKLTAAKLNGADLSGAYLIGATLQRAELNLANLSGARLSDAYLGGAELCRADLSGAYLERAHLARANLSHANLSHTELSRADLSNTDLTRADLTRAVLSRANLSGADLRRATLTRAELELADLSGATLARAELKEARLHRANLSGADLRQADLNGAMLVAADLSGALLKGALLANTDLRCARVNRLDQAFVRGAQFSALNPRWRMFVCEVFFGPLSGWLGRRGWSWAAGRLAFEADPNDPWSVLRQSYAGPRVLFLFFTVVMFTLPYAARAVACSAVSPIEERLAEQAITRRHQLEARLATRPENQELRDEIARIDAMLPRLERKPVWKVVLNWERGKVWTSVLAGFLTLYNVGLYILITKVSALRDEEERSGWTPAWRDYRHLVWVHRLVMVLFYVSAGSFLWNMGIILTEDVIVPRFQ